MSSSPNRARPERMSPWEAVEKAILSESKGVRRPAPASKPTYALMCLRFVGGPGFEARHPRLECTLSTAAWEVVGKPTSS